MISRPEPQQGTTATHFLESNRNDQQARIAARHHGHSHPEEPRAGMISRLEFYKVLWPLTNWRAKDRHDQQARIAARHCSHSQAEEPRTGMISRPEL